MDSGLNFTNSIQYLAIICLVSAEFCCSLDLTISSSEFEQIIFDYSACYCCLSPTQFNLAQCLASLQLMAPIKILETRSLCHIILALFYHQLGWSCWHAKLILFFWYIFSFGNSVGVICFNSYFWASGVLFILTALGL